MNSPNVLFDAARSALVAGDAKGAAQLAESLLVVAPGQPQALHLLAVAERRNGRLSRARDLFASALMADPGNPEICNNYANLLDEMGRPDLARDLYGQAVARAPSYDDAYVNLAVICRKLGAVTEGLAAARRATELSPSSARAWLILGQLREEAGDGGGASVALQRAVQIAPRDPRVLAAIAALKLRRGEVATPAFDRALAVTPDEPDLALGRAASLHAVGDTSAAKAALVELVSAAPGFVAAHEMMAKLHIAEGDAGSASESFKAALAARPHDEALWFAFLQTLSKLGGHEELQRAAGDARRELGDRPALIGFSALAADELGEHDRAAAMLAGLDQAAEAGEQSDAFAVLLVRNQLRTGRFREAATRAEAATARGARALLPYLATAWRLLGDDRWGDLEGNPGFIAVVDSAPAAALVGDLIPVLRRLHTDRAPPLGQTIRRGSQTQGALFLRTEPIIAALADALMAAVKAYVAQLPEPRSGHPLLGGARTGLRYCGSWSVRLSQGAFHVNHVHPDGWIGSAFYVVVPPAGGGDEARAGWLTLGEPPAELGLGLAPFRMVEPRPGRLALFPAYTWHGTRPFIEGERLTVAFDVVRDAT